MGKQDTFYVEGLDDILIGMMATPDTVGEAPTYSEIVRLPIATKLGIKGNGTALEKWASSKMFRRVSRETKHELALDHVGIPIAVMDELKGLIAESGVTFVKILLVNFLISHLVLLEILKTVERKLFGIPKHSCPMLLMKNMLLLMMRRKLMM